MGSIRWNFTLFLILLTFTIGLQYERKILKTGEDFELSCEDDVPVHWCYPPKYKHKDDDKFVYNSPTEEIYSSHIKYKTSLKIEKATYIYTGYYHCVRNDSDARCDRKIDRVKSSYYVFVEDTSHPLLMTEGKYISAYTNGAIILPCLPTHPDVGFELTVDFGEVIKLGKQNSGLTVTYNETVGFILEPATLNDGRRYMCKVKMHNDSLECHVKIIGSKPSYLSAPEIEKDSAKVKSILMRKGTTLKLVCRYTNRQDLSSIDIEWNIPNQSKRVTAFSNCKLNSGRCWENLLTVNNISSDDTGSYNCTVQSDDLKSQIASVKVQVIGQNDVGIILNSSWNSRLPIPKGALQIVVEYIAAEEISVTWYGPDDKPIQTQENKFSVKNTSSQIILKSPSISLWDAGSYKVEVFSKTRTPVWYNISAIILDKPEVYLESSSILFNPGKTANLSCNVLSPPPVDIKWTFTKCNLTQHKDCNVNGAVTLQKTLFTSFRRMYQSNLTFTVNEEGILDCVANNTCKTYCGSNSTSQKIYLTELQELNHTLSIIDRPEEIVAGSTLTLSCTGSVYFLKTYPHWELQDTDLTRSKISNNSGTSAIYLSRNQYTFFSNLTINITKAFHGKTIFCNAEYSSENNSETIEGIYLNVQDPERPIITDTNLNKDIEVKMLDQTALFCKTKGVPKPKLTWYKDGVVIENDKQFRIDETGTWLRIRPVIENHEGEYLCEAKNRVGKAEKKAQLIVTDKPGPISAGLLATILILVPVLLGLLIFLLVKIRKERKLQRELNLAGLANFEKGAMENINPELPVDEQADLLPYDKTWEFPIEKLKLGKMLGAGAFGVVMKAEAYGILDDEEITTVAVKTVKSGADRSYIRALAAELKIMTHLGKHLNVVNLLGASTKRLSKMELMVIVEFCRFGNLHNYLIRHRDDFVDQVDESTGEINLAIGMDKLARSQSTKSKTTLKHRLLSYSSSLIGGSNSGVSSRDLQAPASPTGTDIVGVGSDMSVVSSPNGEPDQCLLSSGSGEQPEWRVKYSGDYGDSSITVCTQNVLCWAFQIARGMEYLVSRKVLHGDLAARNVLLADENIVKICDFGLARSMYKSNNYKKKGGGPLPVKWMALESIRDHIFSTQSDVWSFGIVLWELFSLARTPYPGMEANERLLEKLLNGYRMDQPSHSPKSIYKIMLKCWQEKPDDRPSFTELCEELGALLDDNLRKHFEELNNPYVDMNEQRQSGSDYLNMMGSPNYRNLVSPVMGEHEYVNSPHTSRSEYLNMKSPISPTSANGSVFEYVPEEPNESSYLRMSAKNDVFSPRDVGENPFKFTPSSSSENKTEAHLMKAMRPPNTDNYVNIGSSVSNPAYVTMQCDKTVTG